MKIQKLTKILYLGFIISLILLLYIVLSMAFGKIATYSIIIGLVLLSLSENALFIEKISNLEIRTRIRKILNKSN